MQIDHSQIPTADDDYTPEQRRIIDARLREAEKGPYYGPFKDGAEIAAFLKAWTGGTKPAGPESPDEHPTFAARCLRSFR